MHDFMSRLEAVLSVQLPKPTQATNPKGENSQVRGQKLVSQNRETLQRPVGLFVDLSSSQGSLGSLRISKQIQIHPSLYMPSILPVASRVGPLLKMNSPSTTYKPVLPTKHKGAEHIVANWTLQ